jgi:hypothetical protein
MEAYVPGLIACGVLACITTPRIFVAWVSILTVATCISLVASHHVYREFTILLLVLYVLLLLVANLILCHGKSNGEAIADGQRPGECDAMRAERLVNVIDKIHDVDPS